MRDPKRIDDFCNRLKVVWKQVPDWRFGQLMMNALGAMQAGGRDPFFPEEDEMIKFLENYVSSPSNNPFAKKPNAKFTPGDKVRVIKNSERIPEAAFIGMVGVVTERRVSRDYLVEFQNGDIHAIFEEDLESCPD